MSTVTSAPGRNFDRYEKQLTIPMVNNLKMEYININYERENTIKYDQVRKNIT